MAQSALIMTRSILGTKVSEKRRNDAKLLSASSFALESYDHRVNREEEKQNRLLL